MKFFYQLLKLNRIVKNKKIKLIGILVLHILKRRHLYVNIDPVLLCNLKCRMCYFSDPNNPNASTKKMSLDDINRIASLIFKQTLKLQVGCAAEPTVSKHYLEIINIAKQKYHIPEVSLTTNANLLNKNSINQLIDSGLDEITISMHGISKDIYEGFMPNASHEKLVENLKLLNELKKEKNTTTPNIRINYTVNEDNLDDLTDIFKIFKDITIHTLQVRPIREIGESDYNKFSIDNRIDDFKNIVNKLSDECKLMNVRLLSPDLNNLISDEDNTSSLVIEAVYRYISPLVFWDKKFDWKNKTYYEYAKEQKWGWYLLKTAFTPISKLETTKEHLNYDIV